VSDKVVSLPRTTFRAPVAAVVEMLEETLERARKGELRAIAIASVEAGDLTDYEWARGPDESAHSLAAAMADLAHDYYADRRQIRDS